MYSDGSSRFEVLYKHNYDVWHVWMKAVLMKHDKWGYVNGEIGAPTVMAGDETSAINLSKWKANDEKAMADIFLSMGSAELKTVSKCTTSKEVWEKLQSIHASNGPVRKIELLTDITSFKIDEDADFRERLDKFLNAVEQLEGMKIEIPNDMLVVLILKGLPPSFENFRCAIKSKDDLPNTEVLIGKILDGHRSRQATEPGDDNNALYAGNRYGRDRNRGKQKPKSMRACFICGKTDHLAAKCKQRSSDSAKNVNPEGENFYIEVAQSEKVKNVSSSRRWCLDSGCTVHMCANEDAITDIQDCAATLNMANSTSTISNAKGIAHLTVSTNTGNIPLNLHNT